jgi:hypothetical protein
MIRQLPRYGLPKNRILIKVIEVEVMREHETTAIHLAATCRRAVLTTRPRLSHAVGTHGIRIRPGRGFETQAAGQVTNATEMPPIQSLCVHHIPHADRAGIRK